MTHAQKVDGTTFSTFYWLLRTVGNSTMIANTQIKV